MDSAHGVLSGVNREFAFVNTTVGDHCTNYFSCYITWVNLGQHVSSNAHCLFLVTNDCIKHFHILAVENTQ